MTMCPYKWFLYLASVWAVIYLMLAAVPGSGVMDKNVEFVGPDAAAAAAMSDDEDDE